MVQHHVRATPRATAIEVGSQRITYAELSAACAAVQDALVAQEPGRGDLVGLHFRERWRVVPAILACLAVGQPFAPYDVDTPVARLQTITDMIEPRVVLTDDGEAASAVFPSATPVIAWQDLPIDGSAARHAEPGNPLGLDDLATVYLTSGSTGRPKPIAGRWRGVDAFLEWEVATLGLKAGCRISQLGPATFDGFLKDVFAALWVGGVVCIPTDRDLSLKPDALVDWLGGASVEVLHTVPSVLRTLLHAASVAERLPGLRAIVLAGEVVRPSDAGRLADLFGDRVVTLNLYGPTETTLTKFYHVVRPADAGTDRVPVGRPMPGSTACIIDEAGHLASAGSVGEIVIVSPYCALGYLGLPELSRARFVTDPQGSSDPAYRTGDLGFFNPDGELVFVGRTDNQLKIRGVRIEPEEIENALIQHPDVAEVAVAPLFDASGEASLACYCITGVGVSPNDLMAFLAQRLPRTMLPSTIKCVDDLPRTANGKLDRKALVDRPPASHCQAAARNGSAREEGVAAVFREVLGVGDVDPEVSFFALGGHSLLAVSVLAKIYKSVGVKISMRDLFENSSVKLLSKRIDEMLEAADA